MKKKITLILFAIVFISKIQILLGATFYLPFSKNNFEEDSSANNIKQIVASVQINCTTNTPSNTGAYSWDWANDNVNNYGSSVGASCTISGVPTGVTILSVQYYVDGQLINSNDSPTDHGGVGVPLCDEIFLRVNGPGTIYDVIDIGYSGSDCNTGLINWAGWTGSNTASPNGTYTFDWGSAAEYGPAQDFSVSQIKVVVTYDDGQSNPCPNPNCNTMKSISKF